MKIALVFAALALSSCKEPKSVVETTPAPAPGTPLPAEKMEPDAAMKYVTGLQESVKRASEAKAKADAANKKASEANKIP